MQKLNLGLKKSFYNICVLFKVNILKLFIKKIAILLEVEKKSANFVKIW